ncbi:MAG: bifunctional ornithine acetyltransferase/N-acetylglutamate synthase [Gammaproteobacteria bacterium]|nr:MAG: bifunctional ornithine acetyltransferase/N-acetylglutamate synthase [Gammaproteobacteria bacterium]RKZ44093.1 MAG: bifunctional ornithine acetyltransferase/N-acetylglutamate synthase [Gammaproteobacteria bacterium]RKZ77048.1 MAG: bifunctional ornithine acetyltransferase/N-acetylglutamate synthase [Gammaproteobacteria bacterium]
MTVYPKSLPIAGLKIGTADAQIKPNERNDLTLFELPKQSTCAAVFTRNAFCAAPVTIAKQHLATTAPRFLLINSGNANAGTGERGLQGALDCCEAVAQLTGCVTHEVLPFSTGVIGEPLPVEKIRAALPNTLATLDTNGWENAANAIMTTDTVPKAVSMQDSIDNQLVTVTGIAKGAGMIRPDMATMLVFIATDVAAPPDFLQTCLNQTVKESFNRISIDGDTSTNDACVLVATGEGKLSIDDKTDGGVIAQFSAMIRQVCSALARAIVLDGEGATKFITISVEQGSSEQECLDVAYTIAHSPLVKTAFFASDPNWGRILAAVGRAGVEALEINAVQIYLDDVCIVRNGGMADSYTEEQGQNVMRQKEIGVRVLLGLRGDNHAVVYTCDLSYDYVRINAEYRT